MFILYGVVVGLVAGFLLGGRLAGLATVRFRLGWLAIVALAIQVVLFSSLADGLAADVRRAIYVASTALVGRRRPGQPPPDGRAARSPSGRRSNLAAIVANGGSMPADPAALAALGMTAEGNTNSVVVAAARPRPADRPVRDARVDAAGQRLQRRRRPDRGRRRRGDRGRDANRPAGGSGPD